MSRIDPDRDLARCVVCQCEAIHHEPLAEVEIRSYDVPHRTGSTTAGGYVICSPTSSLRQTATLSGRRAEAPLNRGRRLV